MMMSNIELIRLTLEKSVLENRILRAHKEKNAYMVRELTYDLIHVEDKIKEIQK